MVWAQNIFNAQKQARIEALPPVVFQALPMQDSITIVHGKGERQLAVFADPECSHCKDLETALAKVDNITIHVFLYPVLGEKSVNRSGTIWCTKDQGKSWSDWMLRAIEPVASGCDAAAVKRNLDYGTINNIQNTPTLILQTGRRVVGAQSAEYIEQLLKEAK